MSGHSPFHRLAELVRRQRPPCEGCGHERLCADHALACQAFMHWVCSGRVEARWERVPGRAFYAKVFSGGEDGEG